MIDFKPLTKQILFLPNNTYCMTDKTNERKEIANESSYRKISINYHEQGNGMLSNKGHLVQNFITS